VKAGMADGGGDGSVIVPGISLRCGNYHQCYKSEATDGDFPLCSGCQIVPCVHRCLPMSAVFAGDAIDVHAAFLAACFLRLVVAISC
jgi:hypothetical protein